MCKFFTLFLICCLTMGMAQAERKIVSLNGMWQINEGTWDGVPTEWKAKIPVPSFVDMAEPPFEQVGMVTTNAETKTNVVFVKDPLRDAYWYRRTFAVDGKIPDVAQLRIAKAKYSTTVWLNGTELGTHWPCFTPGYWDMRPSLLGNGQENELIVRVGASPVQVTGHSHEGCDFEKIRYLAGIYDSVDLILSSSPFIDRVQIAPDIEKKAARVVASLKNPSPKEVKTGVVFSVRPYKGGDIVGEIVLKDLAIAASSTSQVEAQIMITDCHFWSPDDPFLYSLETSTSGDTMSTRFGMRTFSFDPKTKMPVLNGHPYPMLGTNICFFRYEEDATRGGTPWDEAWFRRLHRQFKHMHWNCVRYCIGFPPEEWYRIADEEGLLIQDEFPIWTLSKPSETPMEQVTAEYTEWMQAHWNYPSVVIWDAQNESRQDKAPQTGQALSRVRSLDLSNRPWDNGWGDPQAPGDTYEHHSYPLMGFMKNGTGNFEDIMRQFGTRTLADVPKLTENEHPVILNEYAWLWLDRQGNPTVLTQKGYDLIVPNGTSERRQEVYAKTLAAMTEWYRSLGTIAAVMHFCGLGHSMPGCYTSDNFTDLASSNFEPHFERYVRDAFAPVGLMIDWFQATLDRETVEVIVINDSLSPWSGNVTLQLLQNDKPVWEKQQRSSASTLQRTRLAFPLPNDLKSGSYTLEAEIKGMDGEPVKSVRDVKVEN